MCIDMLRKRTIQMLWVAALLMLSMQSWAQFNWPYEVNNGRVTTHVPERQSGQLPALGLRTSKLPVVRVGFVGLGMRGSDAVERWTHIPGIQVVALCDYEVQRANACQQALEKASMPRAAVYHGEKGYEELCARNDLDLVYIATDWVHHFPVARCALEHGKHVAVEVPSAMNLHEIWALIDLVEQKRLHCMILENCCYDFFELNSLSMAQQGVFGEVIYAQGAYRHELSPYWDKYWNGDPNDRLQWRLRYNKDHRGDVYPTHGLGPIAQVMNIHRGDRMETLVAMDTRSFNGRQLVKDRTGEDVEFRNGDHTTTLIRTAQGKVLEIHHNVMTPQPYNRMYQLTGTEGFANKYPREGYAVQGRWLETAEKHAEAAESQKYDQLTGHSYLTEEQNRMLVERFTSPLVTRYEKKAKEVGGHGGMDFIMDSRLVYCLQNGLPLDMDIYDLAEWCCLAELGAISMDNGNLPVEVPDFTRGYWQEQQGYRHAFATPADETRADSIARAFTARLTGK